MGTKEDKLKKKAELRAEAEAKLEGALKKMDDLPAEKMKDVKSLVHEVQVYAIELELQNQELMEAQNDLVIYKDELQELFDFAPVGYLILDEEGIVHNANLTICSQLKVDRKDLIGNKLYSYVAGDDEKDKLFKELRVHFTSGKKASLEIDLIDKNENVINTLVEIAKIEHSETDKNDCRVAVSNISQFKKIEREKEYLETRFEIIADIMTDYTYEFKVDDDNNLELLWVAGAFERITGFTPKESEKRGGWVKLIHPDDIRITDVRAKKLFSGQEDESQFRIICKDGNVKWISDYGKPILKNGRVVNIVGGATEITIEKERELELQNNYAATLNLVEDLSNEIAEREKAESNLKESQAFLSTLLQSIPIPVFYKNKEGKYEGANQAFEEFFGAKQATLVGKSVFDLYPKELAEIYFEKDKLLFENRGTQKYESEVATANGEIRNVIFNKSVYNDNSGNINGLIGTILDVTEERKSRIELEESEEKYRGIIENSLSGIFVADDKGNYLTVNQAAADMLGYSIDELVKMNVADLQTKSQPGAVERYKKYLNTGKETGEFDFVRKDGEERIAKYHAVRIKPDFNISLMNDITEEKKVQIALKESEEKFRTLAEGIEDYIMRYDKEHRHTYANPAALKVSGMTEEEFLGKTHRELGFNPILCDLWEEKIDNVFNNAKPDGAVFEWDSAFGTVYIDWKVIPEFDSDNKVVSALAVSRDITDIKKAEKELKESEEKYRNLFENMVDEVHLWKVIRDKDGKIKTWELVDANPSALKSWGKTKKQVTGKTTDEIFDSSAIDKFMPIVTKIFETGKSLRWEDYFAPTDQYLSMESVPLGEYFLSTGRDITDKKIAENKLKESEERYRAIIEDQTEFISRYKPDGTRTFVNQAYLNYYGVKEEEVIGTNFFDLVNEEDRKRIQEKVNKLVKGEKEILIDQHRVTRSDGSTGWNLWTDRVLYDEHGNVTEIQAVGRDITDQVKAEKELITKMKELEKLNNFLVGRELKMVDLKTEVNELLKKLNKEPKYKVHK